MENEHYFKEKTEIPLSLGILSGYIKDTLFDFYTSPPVFSWREFDKGTIVLAENMKIRKTDKSLLDLGCGYGLLGIVAAFFNPSLHITLIDKSNRAVLLALKNVKKHNLKERAEVLQGDLYEPLTGVRQSVSGTSKSEGVKARKPESLKARRQTFDIIVCNPPYSAGKAIVNKIIEQAPEHLNKNGSLQIVGRKQKGGDMYKQKIIEVFGNCEDFGIESGFRVYQGVKKQ